MAFPNTPTDGQEHKEWIYVSSVGAWLKKPDTPIGSVFSEPGEVTLPSADFPNFCATNFTGAQTVPAELPYLTMKLRQKRLSLDGTFDFSGSASGSDITLDTNTTNENLIADLAEWRLDFGTYTDWLTITWDGVEYPITNINTSTLVISVTGTPTAGAGTANFYPHRIAGSTNARVHSLAGKAFVGAGTTEIMSMGMRRDHGQQITGELAYSSSSLDISGVFDLTVASNPNQYIVGSNGASNRDITFDSALPAGSRVDATTTHPADYGVNVYMIGGPYVA